jgi:hypothetical protein
MSNEHENFKFSYNDSGEIIPPSTLDTPFGILLMIAALLVPLLTHLPVSRDGLTPYVIQYLPNFWVLRRAGYLSDGDLAIIEAATGIWLLVRVANFLLFRRHLLSFFSEANPPPSSLRERWQIQYSKFLKLGALVVVAPFALAPLVYFIGMLSSRYGLAFIAIFGCTCLFFTEALSSLGLYLTFKSRFWRDL